MKDYNLDFFDTLDELDKIYEELELDESSNDNMLYIAIPMDQEKPLIKFNNSKDAKKILNKDGVNNKYKFYIVPRKPFENLKACGRSDKSTFLNLCRQGICKPVYRITESLDESLSIFETSGYKIKNVPEYATNKSYIVAKYVDDELWFNSAWSTQEDADRVAIEVDGLAIKNSNIGGKLLFEALDTIYLGVPVTMHHDAYKTFVSEKQMEHHRNSINGYRYQYYGVDKKTFKDALKQMHNVKDTFKYLQNHGQIVDENLIK